MDDLIEDIAEASAEFVVNENYRHLSCAAREKKRVEFYDVVLASLFALIERLPKIPTPSDN